LSLVLRVYVGYKFGLSVSYLLVKYARARVEQIVLNYFFLRTNYFAVIRYPSPENFGVIF